ncbi:MAG: sugar ABC transporter ATP-binding protein [Eubacteriales bacterium]|jgi:ABC-type sugar transport system ATPase subunit
MDELLLKATGITKKFSGVTALDQVNFELRKGEVHALMGENGAGKSTLAKVIVGIHSPTEGKVFLEGEEVHFDNTRQASAKGISMVFQEFNLLPHLSVAENMFLTDNSFFHGGLIDKKAMVEKSTELLKIFNMDSFIDPYEKVSNLSVAQMQIIEILKAVSTHAKVIILDEPTATLSPNEVEGLFRVVRQLKAEGVGFIIVSHRINEIYEISDRITVLRDGKLILLGAETASLPQNELIKAMVGREVNDLYGKRTHSSQQVRNNPVVLDVKGVSDTRNFVQDVSFQVHAGEILGISGLVGAGRTELIRNIFGIDRRGRGEVYLEGKLLPPNNIHASIKAQMGFVSEDRKQEGLLQDLSIVKNTCLTFLSAAKSVLISQRGDDQRCLGMIDKLNIKVSNIDNPVRSLSGGNQQKVLLAKWLLCNPKVLFVDEPTRGIDIAAKSEIYAILKELASNGIAVVMVSSEIPEILGISDRVLVMRDGRLIKELDIEEATEEKIGYYSTIGAQEQETIKEGA